ncbi:MAG: nucleotidyltransferase family protein [Alysiella sp.]|uniref:N-acetylmuramate alpha-1-phosphate uridylyltransferase MurU n=1 Tax=Alysiella sp. TaxID=1872483 RepID=UPI0026DB52B6|nr:nucleotidyltransferase family protein [Alysiella sp.]MDO4433133.1 nucleotidyltransferase family protein [Alysiella sp.]
MKAMILAAGRGERMRPLTDHTPKPLLRAGDEPLIGWHLRRLKAAGITEIIINHAWLGHKIETELGNGAAYGVNIAYSREGEQGLETAGGIATALPLLGDKPFLVINGDILSNIGFQAACQRAAMLPENQLAYLWLVPNPPHNPNGDFTLGNTGKVHAHNMPDTTMLTFSGVGIYRPELFVNTPAHQVAKLAPLLRQAMQAEQVYGEIHTGIWLDVGTPERLAQADKLLRSGVL